MYRLLRPDLYVSVIQDIPLAVLKKKGIHGLLIDLDNTIIEWGGMTLSPAIKKWFEEVKGHSFKACLVSNNRSRRVKAIADILEIPFISGAGKPRSRAFKQAITVLGTGIESTAVIGDQVFTDVLGGNRLGLFTVLVKPMNSREFFGTRIMRRFERIVTRRLAVSNTNSND